VANVRQHFWISFRAAYLQRPGARELIKIHVIPAGLSEKRTAKAGVNQANAAVRGAS
jgi:hypothetical protein